MTQALVPAGRNDRPSILRFDGGHVYISVHDAAYEADKRAWKQKLASAHPDHGGRPALFRRVRAQFDQWLASEAAWYRHHGIGPPGQAAGEPITALVTAPRRNSNKSLSGRLKGQCIWRSPIEIRAVLATSQTIMQAAETFGLCQVTLKRLCRRYEIAITVDGRRSVGRATRNAA